MNIHGATSPKLTLPYVRNLTAVLLTLAINLIVVLLLFRHGATLTQILIDSVTTAIITTAIAIAVTYPAMVRMRAAGALPRDGHDSKLMRSMPVNPVALGAIGAALFIVITVAINWMVLHFIGVDALSFTGWLVYKLIYSTMLSIKITEFVVYRYVQPDWVGAARIGDAADSPDATTNPVRPPMPKISTFTAFFGSVATNLAMNIVMGLLLGGTVITADKVVALVPTMRATIWISGLAFGLITGLLVTLGAVRVARPMILNAVADPAVVAAAEPPKPDRRFTWMPRKTAGLIAVICPVVMVASALALWGILRLLNLDAINFIQYSVLVTVWAAIVAKPLTWVLTKRLSQPDYVQYLATAKN